jgi:ABC-2 type transport system permease protein
MFKLLKYEMYSRSKLMAGVVLGILFFNIVIITKIDITNYNNLDMAMGLTFLIVFAAGVIAFIDGILSYRRDLYSESGYLTFTLPKRAYYVINTKLAASLIELAVYGIIGGGFFFRMFLKADQSNKQFIDLITNYKLETFEVVFLMVISILFTFLLAYFAMTVSRAVLGNKKYAEFGAIALFFFLNYIFGRISFEIFKLFHFTSTNKPDIFFNKYFFIVLFYELFWCLLLLVGTHLIIEKKVDL